MNERNEYNQMKDRKRKEAVIMKKTYKIEVDCANCANKMEDAAKKTAGVKDAVVNFMALKMSVEFEEVAELSETVRGAGGFGSTGK